MWAFNGFGASVCHLPKNLEIHLEIGNLKIYDYFTKMDPHGTKFRATHISSWTHLFTEQSHLRIKRDISRFFEPEAQKPAAGLARLGLDCQWTKALSWLIDGK
jgi:hypothetical protein